MHFSMLLCYIRKDLNFSWFFGYGRRLIILSVLTRRLFYHIVATATTALYIFYLSDTISTNKLLIFIGGSNIVVSSRVLPVVFFLPTETLQYYIIIVVSRGLKSTTGAVGDLLWLAWVVATVFAKILAHLRMIDSFFEVSKALWSFLVTSKASSTLFFLFRSRLFFNLSSKFFNVIVDILLQFGKIVLREQT
jgi:hypothetical protein